MSEPTSIMLSAGEASGDLHGGALCRELRALAPAAKLFGLGGPRMAAAGMDVVADLTAHAVVGGSEALGRLPRIWRTYRSLVRCLREERPGVLVVIDFAEFNMRLARAARRSGVPVVFFIPPQVWAWRRRRVRLIARLASRVLAVFPFEPGLYEAVGARVEFVGHPLLDVLPLGLPAAEARRRLGVAVDAPLVGLLPGSRREEVERLLPAMVDAAARLAVPDGRRRFVLGQAPSVAAAQVARALAARPDGAHIQVVNGLAHEVMAAADVVLVASGTATLETALLGTPMVVCYRVSRLTELLLRCLIDVRWVSLPNLLAGRSVVPELLQGAVSGARLAAEATRLLEDPAVITGQRAAFQEIRARLGRPGVARRAARAVLDVAGAVA